MRYFTVHLDRETSERAGAGGMFQVISIKDEEEKDRTDLVDQGAHYPDLDKLAADIAKALNTSPSEITLDEV